MLTEFIIFVIVLIFWWRLEDKKRYKGFPPGPPRFPVVGNLPQLITKDPNPAIAFEKLSKTYGDIMFFNVGKFDAVVFSSQNTIVDIFNHEKASERATSKIPVVNERCMLRNLGVIWSNDDVWLTLRRFTLRTLRDFGFGKTLSMDFVINEEMEKMTAHVDKLIASNNGIVHFDGFFDLTVINVLWRLVTGVNYRIDDPRITHLLRMSNEMVKNSNFAFDIAMAYPWLRDWFPEFFARSVQQKIAAELHKFCRDTFQEHRDAGTYSTDPKGFVDIFLEKIDEEQGDPKSYFNDDQLLMTILDLFQAGAETTSKTLSFGMLYMLLNPEIQEKVHKEITSVVQIEDQLTMSNKSQLPYSYATLMEVLRYSVVVPFPPMRQASEDFYYQGHFIKKGTSLMPNVYAAHFSEKVWEDPFVFRPERFLTKEGKVDPKIENLVLPFGGGKRVCVGRNLAEANLFLYFTTMLKNYKLEKVPNTPDPSVVAIPGMTLTPQPYNAVISKRKA